MPGPEYYQERMVRLVEDPLFQKKLGQIASFSRRTGQEAGLVAYTTSSGYQLSKVVRPKPSAYETDDFGIENGIDEYNSVNMGEAVLKVVHGKAQLRKDLLLDIHSHACEPLQADMMLCPSINDIAKEERWRNGNPQLVSGILVPRSAETGSLLLYRQHDPNRPAYYQQIDDNHSSSNILLQSMRDSGMTMAVLDFTVERSVAAYDPAQASQVVRALYPAATPRS